MAKRRSHNDAGRHLPELVDRNLIRALDHVVRQHILLLAAGRPISPVEVSKLLDEPLPTVSYHTRILHDDCEIIELTKRTQVRGAVEHHYRTSAKTLLSAKLWRGLKDGLRAAVGARQASDLFNDLAEAVKAGKLQGEDDHISRTPLILDAKGQSRVKAIAERATREVEDEQREAAERMSAANGEGGDAIGVSFAVLAFETAWEPADMHARAVEAQKEAKKGRRRKPKGKRKTATEK